MGKNKYTIYRVPGYKRYKAKSHTIRYGAIFAVALILSISFLTIFSPKSRAAALTWDGGGGDNNWSTCANWSGDACPVAADTLTFNGTSTKDSVIDAGWGGTVTSITIASGYTGTITVARSLTLSGAFSQATGTFNSGSETIDFNSSFTLSGGIYTASSGSTTLAGAMTVSGSPTFNHNSGTWTFDGGAATVSCSTITFNLVVFNHTAGGAKTISSGCSLPLGNNPNTGPGNFVLNGTFTGSGTLTGGSGATLTYGTTGSLSGFTGLVLTSLTLNGTLNAGSYTTFDINGTFTTASTANLTMPAGTATFAGGFTLASGMTFNANGGTIEFDGTSTVTVTCNSATFSLVRFAHTSGTKTVSSNCTLPLGNNPSFARDISLSGTLTGTGTISGSTSATFIIGATGSLSGFSGANFNTLTINGATFNASSYSPFDLNGAFNLNSSGVFTAPALMTVGASFTISAGTTFNHNSGIITFDGATQVITCNSATFNQVNISNTSGTVTVSSGCTLPIGSNPTVGSGTTADLTVSGTLTGTGTITLASKASGNVLTLASGGVLSGFTGLDAGALTVSGGTYDLSGMTTLFATSSTLTQSGGTLTLPNGTSLFALSVSSGATFNAPAGSLSVANDFTLAAGSTFNHNSGTIIFTTGTNHRTITCNSATFNLVQFTNNNFRKTVSSGCTLPLGSSPTLGSLFASVILSGTLTGSGTLGAPTLTIESSGVLSGFSGYSGTTLNINSATIDFGSYTTFAVAGAFTLTGGSVTAPNNADFNGNFTVSGATFNAPSGTVTFASNFTLTTATFNANGGTVIFDGSSNATLACDNATFNLVDFNHFNTRTVGADCNLPLGADPSIGAIVGFIAGSIDLYGELSGSGTLDSVGAITLRNGSSLSGFTGFTSGALTVDSATYDFSSMVPFNHSGYSQTSGNVILPDGDMTVLTNFTVTGGIITAPGGVLQVAGNFQLSAPTTFTHNGGTIELITNPLGFTSTVYCDNATFNLFVIDVTTPKHIESDCNIPLGNNPTITGNNTLSTDGTLSGTGTLNASLAELIMYTGSLLSGFNGLSVGSFVQSGGTQNFNGYNTFDVNGTFEIGSSGTFTATSANTTVSGNFDIQTGATFNHNNGTVILDGTNQTMTGATFNNLNKTVASASTLTLTAGQTVTTLGTLTLKGASGQLLSLVSSAPGVTQWQINSMGSHDIRYVSVTDSNNTGSTLSAYDSNNGGNNINWSFVTTSTGGNGSTGGSSGSSSGTTSSGRSSSSGGTSATDEEIVAVTNGEAPSQDNTDSSSDPFNQSSDRTEAKNEDGEGLTILGSKKLSWLIVFGVPLFLLGLGAVFFFSKKGSDSDSFTA